MQNGSWLSHRSRPEWGAGQVVAINGSHCEIEFESGTHIKIAVANISQYLQRCPPGTLKLKPAKVRALFPCEHCGRSLRSSIYNASKTLKSCPRCSTQNGHHHVFYDHPDGFGVSARADGRAAEGVLSHCKRCRFDQLIPGRGNCDDVRRPVAVVALPPVHLAQPPRPAP